MKTTLSIISVLALATSLTYAQEAPRGPKKPGKDHPAPEEIFKKLDADSSGSVSLEEFKASKRAQEKPEKAEEIFNSIDKDGNGELSLEEFKSHRPPHKPGEGGPGKPGKPGKPGGPGKPGKPKGEGAPPAQ
jgi:hypothetical protein